MGIMVGVDVDGMFFVKFMFNFFVSIFIEKIFLVFLFISVGVVNFFVLLGGG